MIELPPLASYSDEEIERLNWPAILRYRELLTHAPQNESDRLRLRRHEAWLKCALATALDRCSAEMVCTFWSEAVDGFVLEAWLRSGCEQLGFGLLALGKLGARELNLSSDVDLIAVRKDDSPPETKSLRAFQTLLAELTPFGFCVRVDFTLRPGGQSGSLIPSITEFENYYGYHGEAWEKLAFVRMRCLSAPSDLRSEIESFATKYSFRKHLDYTMIDELRHLRGKVRSEKSDARPGYLHLKLGRGGIRELELFVHALQVMHGGRRPELRTGSTSEALRQIKALELLPAQECDDLLECYWTLRSVENRLQAYDDQQTYLIGLSKPEIALRSGDLERILKTCSRVDTITSSFFEPAEKERTFPEGIEAQRQWLEDLGFSERSIDETWPELLSATSLSRKTERDESARLLFLGSFVTKLSEIGLDRDLGLSLLLDFVKATRAKATFFTLLNRETRVQDELASLFSVSPYLGGILTSRPELIDEFIFRRQSSHSDSFDVLLEELAERRLLAELIASTQFLTDFELNKMSRNLTANADAICMTLLDRLKQDYGSSPLRLLALGKWGGCELGLQSDLDFVFVSPREPTPEDHRIAKRFISRLTEPHRGGAIYSIDTRLRPSGNAGPIIVSEEQLKSYLSNEAAAWERQAYLRSRPLSPLTFQPAETAAQRGLDSGDIAELSSIRQKLFGTAKPGEIDLKLVDGGLADIEFTAQIALLAQRLYSLDTSTEGMIEYLGSTSVSWKKIGAELVERYSFLRRVEQLHRLTSSQSGSKIRVKSEEFRRIALVLRIDAKDLAEAIASTFSRVCELLTEVRSR